MNDRERARFDAFKRIKVFGGANTADFPAASKGAQLFGELGVVITALGGATTAQTGGGGQMRSGTTSKAVQRDGLLAELRSFNRTAAALAEAQGKPEILEEFRLAYGNTDEGLIAKAHAFATAAGAHEDEFIELGHDQDFIAALEQRVTDFGNADTGQNTGEQARSGATANIGAKISDGLKVTKQLDAIMHNKYKSNAGKMGEWITASHIERAGSTPTATPPTPPPPSP